MTDLALLKKCDQLMDQVDVLIAERDSLARENKALLAKVDMYEAALKDKFGSAVLEGFDNPQHLKSW